MGDTGTGVIVAPVVARAHRRGMIMLIGVAAALLIGVAVAVVLIIQNTSDDSGGSLGHIREYDQSRPEEIVRAHMLPQEGSGATGPVAHNRPRFVQHPNGTGGTGDETPGTGTKIKSDEVEDMANKNSSGTQRCYIRAQRGAAGIETADLKRLSVTLTIDKTGAVTDVQFTEKTAEMLLTCLRTQIRLWKFRESPGGMYRIVLAFGSG
jgi:hypothetical protein